MIIILIIVLVFGVSNTWLLGQIFKRVWMLPTATLPHAGKHYAEEPVIQYITQKTCSSCGKAIEDDLSAMQVEVQIPLPGNKTVPATLNICQDHS